MNRTQKNAERTGPGQQVETILSHFRSTPDNLIEMLHAAQQQHGHLAKDVLERIAAKLHLPRSLVYGVASFYHAFRLEPPGRRKCVVCTGTSCHIKGGTKLLAELEQRFGVPCGTTSHDGALTLETVRCLGACGLAPLAMIDGAACANATCESVAERLNSILVDEEKKP